MKNHDRDLLDDLLRDDRREATLLSGARVLRQRRLLRHARTILPLVTAGLAATAVLTRRPPPPTAAAVAAPAPAAARDVHSLSDAELLALFPKAPRAIITVKGEQMLVFTRPADAARYIGRASPDSAL